MELGDFLMSLNPPWLKEIQNSVTGAVGEI